jgi:hypothetical protein
MPTTKSRDAKKRKPGDSTPKQHPNLKEPWKPGRSGNPAGRPKGSRNKINEFFLRDLQALWEEQGCEILAATARTKPDVIVKAMVALLPKHVEASNQLDELTDEELAIIAEVLFAKYGDPRTRRNELPSHVHVRERRLPHLTEDDVGTKQHAAPGAVQLISRA